jgi:rRNA processing protein Gar1
LVPALIRLGYFIHVTPSKKLLVKISGKRPPRIGAKVVTSSGEVVGKVVDVIGPITAPYAVIKPLRGELHVAPYEEVYLKPSRRGRK